MEICEGREEGQKERWKGGRNNSIMPFVATWMQLEIIILSEVSQKEKDK